MKKLLVLIALSHVTGFAMVQNQPFDLKKWLFDHNCYKDSRTPEEAQNLTELFRLNLMSRSQQEKDETIKEINQHIIGDPNHSFRKALIKGAVLAGGQTNCIKNNQRLNESLGKAVIHDDLEFTKFLLAHGANPQSLYNGFGEILFVAKSVEIAQLLIQHGAVPKLAQNPIGNLIHAVITQDRLELLSLYIKHGVNINDLDNYGHTPLHSLCYKGDWWKKKKILSVARLLLDHGARTNIKNQNKLTPVQQAFVKAKGHQNRSDKCESVNAWITKKRNRCLALGKFIIRHDYEQIMKEPTCYSSLLPKDIRNLIFEYVAAYEYDIG